jgi:hypothetical protein
MLLLVPPFESFDRLAHQTRFVRPIFGRRLQNARPVPRKENTSRQPETKSNHKLSMLQ